MMDNMTLRSKLEAAISEEADDAAKYAAMVAEVDDKYAGILNDIAREELGHREHLMAILEDLGPVPAPQAKPNINNNFFTKEKLKND